MVKRKRFNKLVRQPTGLPDKSIVLWALILLTAQAVMGQSGPDQDRAAEASYLQQTTTDKIIREQSRADDRESKLAALRYIKQELEKGNTGTVILEALGFMADEGVLNKRRVRGQVVNNYPDIRTTVATCLGDTGTPEAETVLIRMVKNDTEPMVLTEAIKSLIRLGLDTTGASISVITKTVSHFDTLNPNNMLALVTLEAYDQFAAQSGGKLDSASMQLLIRMLNSPYIKSVQNRANQVLVNLHEYSQ
jgi:HEAT repeat protein